MSVDAVRMPLIFGGSESDAVHGAGEGTVRTRESNLHRVGVVPVLVNDHDGPLSIRALDGVGGDQYVAGCVAYVAGCAKEPVCGVYRLHPLFADYLCREILREISRDFVILIDIEKAERAAAAFRRQSPWQVVKEIGAARAAAHHGPDIIGQPEAAHDIDIHLSGLPGHVAFRHEERKIGGQAIIFPDFEDVADDLRLAIEIAPGILTSFVGIMFEGEKCEIVHSVVRLQGVEKSAEPRDRKSTRLNSSHLVISYAVFCLK